MQRTSHASMITDRAAGQVMEAYQPRAPVRMRVLRLPNNGGPGVARNRGAEAASSQVCFKTASRDKCRPAYDAARARPIWSRSIGLSLTQVIFFAESDDLFKKHHVQHCWDNLRRGKNIA